MEWPDLMPSSLDYCRKVRGEEQIIPTLIGKSDEDLIRFFEAACDDETWTSEHKDFMKSLVKWITIEFSSKRLRVPYGKRVVAAIHQHSAVMLPLLPKNMTIRVADYSSQTNTLLWASLSPYFLDLVERMYSEKKPLFLAFPDISADMLKTVEEYVNTGSVSYIWRRPLNILMTILMRAGQWRLSGLIDICATVVRRYVNRETATDILNTAQAYVLPAVKESCCEVLNQMSLGAFFEPGGEADLIVTIEEIRDLTLPMLTEVAPSITHLILKGTVAQSQEIKQLLPKCIRLASFGLTGSSGCDLTILPLLPPLRELNLSDCSWLTDPLAIVFLSRFFGINIINLSENDRIGFPTFRKLSEQIALETLNCVYCSGLEDGCLEAVVRGCTQLTEVRIAWCPKITDVGLRTLGTFRPNLRVVDVSNCTNVSDAGIHDLVRPCQQLQRLSMAYLPLVSEDGILKIPALCPTLRYLDIRLCRITDAGIGMLKERYPHLELEY